MIVAVLKSARVILRTQNAERETKSPKQAKPLSLLRANRKQANLGIFKANLSDIQANRSAF